METIATTLARARSVADDNHNSPPPSSLLLPPSSIVHHPSSIIHHPSSIIHHPSSINLFTIGYCCLSDSIIVLYVSLRGILVVF
jgi:hypothetical protein